MVMVMAGVVLHQPAVRPPAGCVWPSHDHRDRLRDDGVSVRLLQPARHEIDAVGLLAILLSNLLQDMQYGPQAAFIVSELSCISAV
jgi:hypothetical protein